MGRSLPEILPMSVLSAIRAKLPHPSRMAGTLSISRIAGIVCSSPLRARSTNWLNSWGSVGTLTVATFVVATSLSPCAALVLARASGQQRGTGYEVGQFDQSVEVGVESLQVGF